MKKTILTIAAAIAALFVVSCQKQEVPAKEYTINLNVAEKPSLDPDTKAVRTSWQSGDEIYLSFVDDACKDTGKYLKFTYDGSSWSLATDSSTANTLISALTATESGKCSAIASTSGNLTYSEYSSNGSTYGSQRFNTNGDEVLIASNADYSVSGGNVTVTLTFAHESQYCQVTVKGIDSSWRIYGDGKFGSPFNYVISVFSGTTVGMNPGGGYISAVSCSEGAKFYGQNDWNTEGADMTFLLKHSTYGTWTKTFTGKGKAGKCAFIFQGPTELTGSEAVNDVVDGWKKTANAS